MKPGTLIFYCRNCGRSMSMMGSRIDQAFCSPACKQSLYRKRLRLRKIKKNGINHVQGVTNDTTEYTHMDSQ